MGLKQYDKRTLTDDIHLRIPEGWRSERLYDVAEIKTSTVDKKSVEGQNSVRLCNYKDVYYNGKIKSNINFMESTASDSEIVKFKLNRGDVVFTKDSEDPFDIGIPSYIDDEIEDLVCGYHLTIVKSFKQELLGEYTYYALKSEIAKHQFSLVSNGVTRFGLTYQGAKNIKICIPSISEQKQIANFLDYKTAQIDRLIEKKKQLIDKLNEKRIAVITQAVTKGLDPSVPMKDSGVDWLGEVPEHWDVRRLKECSELISKGTTPSTEGLKTLESGEIRFIKAENIYNGHISDQPANFIDQHTNFILRRSILQENDILFVIAGATLGKIAVVKHQHLPANTNQAIAFIRPTGIINAAFLYYWLQSDYIYKLTWLHAVQSAQPNLAMGVLGNFITLVPPTECQEKIVSFLQSMLNKINDMINLNGQTIECLSEYRMALITATVTGKIDVREVLIPDQEAMSCDD